MNNNRMSTLQSSVLNSFGLEIGIFCMCSTAVSILILKAIKGDLSGLEALFATKDWLFIKKSVSVGFYASFFKWTVIFMVMWPLLSLVAWSASVFNLASNLADPKPSDYLPGVAILLVGLTIALYVIPILQLKWNNF